MSKMSKKFELPPMVGVDPAYSPRTGRLRTLEEIEALERGRPAQITLGFSGKPGAVAGISGRDVRLVDPAYLKMLQEPAHTEFGVSSVTASGVMSATLARARREYDEELERTRVLLNEMAQKQWNQHREHGPGPAQPQQRARPRSLSPEHGPARARSESPRSEFSRKYPPPQNIREAFAILGILPTSTTLEIRQAYRKMAMVLHPDKNLHNLIEAEEKFKIKKPDQMGGRNRSYRLYRKLKTHRHHRSHHRRRNSRHAKRSHKSSKSSKRYSKKYRR
jgi:DnaJ domain